MTTDELKTKANKAGLPVSLRSLAGARKDWKGTRNTCATLYYNYKTGRFLTFEHNGNTIAVFDPTGPDDPSAYWVSLDDHWPNNYFPLTSDNLWMCFETGLECGWFLPPRI